MDECFKIHVEQLRDGRSKDISGSYSPEFLDIHEKSLAFLDPVEIHGEVYLVEEMLMMHVDISTLATIPCSICNNPVKVKTAIQGYYHGVPLSEIRGGIYYFHEILRETILLEIPILAECNDGKCPARKEIKKYLKQETSSKSNYGEETGYRPFADLDLK